MLSLFIAEVFGLLAYREVLDPMQWKDGRLPLGALLIERKPCTRSKVTARGGLLLARGLLSSSSDGGGAQVFRGEAAVFTAQRKVLNAGREPPEKNRQFTQTRRGQHLYTTTQHAATCSYIAHYNNNVCQQTVLPPGFPEEGTRLLEQAQNLLEEFTQLCSTGDEEFSDPSAPVGQESRGRGMNGDWNGGEGEPLERGKGRIPPSSLSSSGETLQENIVVDPDDITPESHDSQVKCVPPAPETHVTCVTLPHDSHVTNVVEDDDGDRFEDAMSELPENPIVKIAASLQQSLHRLQTTSATDNFRLVSSSSRPTALPPSVTCSFTTTHKYPRTTSPSLITSVTNNPQPKSLTQSLPMCLSPTSKSAPHSEVKLEDPVQRSPSLTSAGPPEATDGGKVGVLFGGAAGEGKGGEGEGGLEISMEEFDSFLEGVSYEDLAMVCKISSCLCYTLRL